LASVGAIAVAETHDPWCAACHLPPEEAFVARAAGRRAVDLASAHAKAAPGRAARGRAASEPAVRCIDCHGGPGWRGRAHSLRIAAADTWSWARGAYVVVGTEYAPLGEVKHPVADALCAGCHADAIADTGFENHFHSLLADPEAPDDLDCVDCHAGHRPRPADPYFLSDADAAPGCRACHDAMGGPGAPFGR